MKAAIEPVIPVESLEKLDYHPIEKFTNLTQKFHNVKRAQKLGQLLTITKRLIDMDKRVIICSRSTNYCNDISMFLADNGISCIALTGRERDDCELSQKVQQFNDGDVKVASKTHEVLRDLSMDGVFIFIVER